MKVPVYTTVDIDTEVSVSVEDITAALNDALAEAREATREDGDGRHAGFMVGQFVSAVYQCLEGLTDDMIKTITRAKRAMIAEKFVEMARWFDRLETTTEDTEKKSQIPN